MLLSFTLEKREAILHVHSIIQIFSKNDEKIHQFAKMQVLIFLYLINILTTI